MRPRLLLSHTIAPIKNRSVCADFWSEKKSVRFFLGAACEKKSVMWADSVREKIRPSLRLFLGAPYDTVSQGFVHTEALMSEDVMGDGG